MYSTQRNARLLPERVCFTPKMPPFFMTWIPQDVVVHILAVNQDSGLVSEEAIDRQL